MSESSEVETAEGWTHDLPISGRAASTLEDAYDSEEDLIEAYRQADDIIDVPQIGQQRMQDIREHILAVDPDAKRARKENDEAICTEFTQDHGIEDPDPDTFYFAFICPRCGAKNPCHGDPEGFGGRPFRCEDCNWVSLLDGESIAAFAEEAGVDA